MIHQMDRIIDRDADQYEAKSQRDAVDRLSRRDRHRHRGREAGQGNQKGNEELTQRVKDQQKQPADDSDRNHGDEVGVTPNAPLGGVQCVGRVVWIRGYAGSLGPSPGMGIEFRQIDPDSRAFLSSFCIAPDPAEPPLQAVLRSAS